MVFDKKEALCIFLKRFAYPCRWQDLMLKFGQSAPVMGQCPSNA